jgi:26S proteasome regulatory subunit N6
MLLCKVMLNLVRFLRSCDDIAVNYVQPEDVNSLLTIKLALKYVNLRDVESMRAIARAHQNRNLADFEKALKEYQHGESIQIIPSDTEVIYKQTELASDPTIRSHLTALYDTLLEQNLLRIVEPYSVVEISYVAEMVGQERQAVEAKLSQMILDKVLYGVLDQGRGCLLVYDEPEVDESFSVKQSYNQLNPLCRTPMGLQLRRWSRLGRLSSPFMPKSVLILLLLIVTDCSR